MGNTRRLRVLHNRAVIAYREGSAHRWVACLAASRVVGQYERGATQELARSLALSVSQVENLARSGLVYRYYRRFGIDSDTRKKLTPGHFAAIGDLIVKYDLTPWDVVSTLKMCADHGISIAVMRSEIEKVEGGGQAWFKQVSNVRAAAATALENDDLPPDARAVVREFLWRLGYLKK